MSIQEANFDGLVGPTHHYGGLSFGNVASARSRHRAANPKAAALQGLEKMRYLMDLGLPQGVIAPQERPHLPSLRRLGFSGSDAQVLSAAATLAPRLLGQTASASCMWTANAATVTPSADSGDGRVHFTPANLINKFHRAIETETTGRVLRALFPDSAHFAHHPALPAHPEFGDEGAANHNRLIAPGANRGVGFFVYGQDLHSAHAPAPTRYPARHTRAASEAIVRSHGLSRGHSVFAQQHPEAIDAGAFHNDVVGVANGPVLFCHQRAYFNAPEVYQKLDRALDGQLQVIEISEQEVPLQQAIQTYLFNSQLVTLPSGAMALILPKHCEVLEEMLATVVAGSNPIESVHLLDVHQSMDNGGGPACLRLRVALNEAERAAVNPQVWLSAERHAALIEWVERHYRDQLLPEDLADPQLLDESRTALDALTQLLGLGSVYEFQREPGEA